MPTINGDDYVMREETGRHICCKCRHYIRVGEKYDWRDDKLPFRRGYRTKYWHVADCMHDKDR